MLRNSSGDWNAGINAVRLDTESGSVEKKGAGAEQEGEGGEERREWMKGRDRCGCRTGEIRQGVWVENEF